MKLIQCILTQSRPPVWWTVACRGASYMFSLMDRQSIRVTLWLAVTVWTSAFVSFYGQCEADLRVASVQFLFLPSLQQGSLTQVKAIDFCLLKLQYSSSPWDAPRTHERGLAATYPCSFLLCGLLDTTASMVVSAWCLRGSNRPPPFRLWALWLRSIQSNSAKPQIRSLFRTKVNI